MSSLAGIVRFDGQAIPQAWITALGAGPEDLGRIHIIAGSSALALIGELHRPAGEGAPLILADARLDQAPSSSRYTGTAPDSDEAILAQGFAEWGSDVAAHLEGDFAFATWQPDRQRLILGRSALGTRPIYHCAVEGGIAFSSSLPALLRLPTVSRKLDDDWLCRSLTLDGTSPATSTSYQDVRRVPGGHTLIADRAAMTLIGNPAAFAERIPARARNADDYALLARERIIEAVESRLTGAKTLAVHLSGGLDSSAIACITARRLKQEGRRLVALCSVLPQGSSGPEQDERPFIEAVLAQEDNIDPVWVEQPLDQDPFSALQQRFDCLGQPPLSNVSHIESPLAEPGRQRGVDAVLNGFGGDFFISAPAPHAIAEHLVRARWIAAGRELRALRRRFGESWSAILRREVTRPLLRRYVASARLPRGSIGVNPDLAARIGRQSGRAPMASAELNGVQFASELKNFLLEPGKVERVLTELGQVFRDEFAQDIRFPLLDRRLVAAALAIPYEQFQLDGWPRSLMRRAMTGILPETIRQRPCKGAAYDPALASRCIAARTGLEQWAAQAPERCWDYVDKPTFLAALSQIEPADRDDWRMDMFTTILQGGRIARFIEWHERQGANS